MSRIDSFKSALPIILGIVIILSAISYYAFFKPPNKEHISDECNFEDGEVISIHQLGKCTFKDGDYVIVKGKIANISYLNSNYGDFTYITLEDDIYSGYNGPLFNFLIEKLLAVFMTERGWLSSWAIPVAISPKVAILLV